MRRAWWIDVRGAWWSDVGGGHGGVMWSLKKVLHWHHSYLVYEEKSQLA